ncbi:N-formylglutamate amidohydrolase [Sphingomonas sp. KC8]|uniref:N-formylglutamate amidohydrolase n=1 Tax=Sphingomonas sp. KC8 TaxID=1030157 RepID=UPI000498679A|nr:N-formylglutamate amidohydrolase [Sphingomonas sp. KC8]ARS29371.1 N-formylglutamate amidohydrolase [Sphingomonas sp. KC8]
MAAAPPFPTDQPPSFVRHGPARPTLPVVLAVPHAGRDYPPTLLAMARAPLERLESLEDRHADLLVDDAVAAGATAFLARRARSWIDLNRDEREIDPGMIDPPPRTHSLIASAKMRGGLGLIPRRLADVGEIWNRRLSAEELAIRVNEHHRPWHSAIATALDEAQARFGTALLIDCHSMPPLPPHSAARPPHIVLGDRYGATAPALLMDRLTSLVEAAGLVCARNSPYAGGHTLDRQARRKHGIFAIQVEVDRSLYLAPGLRDPGEGLPRIRTLIGNMVSAMAEELSAPLRRAAE